MIRAAACLWIGLASGCGSYLLPFDERPLPAPRSLETVSGLRLDLDREGRLIARPELGDVGEALGVGLVEEQGAVVVTHRLRPGAALRPGDRLLRVWPRVAPAAGVADEFLATTREALGIADDPLPSSLGEALDERRVVSLSGVALDQAPRQTVLTPPEVELAPPSLEEIRARGQAVGSLEDLRGYATAAGWLTLDLLVARGEEELAVRAELRREPRPVFARPWTPSSCFWKISS